MKNNLIIFGCGLAGTGKTTHLKKLAEIISAIMPCVYIDKDDINAELGQAFDANSEYYKKVVAPLTYQIIAERAQAQVAQGKIVILDGYFGNKLSISPVKEQLISTDFETRIIYFHCTAGTQQARLIQRGLERDQDKEGRKFEPYRLAHLQEHIRELAQVPHFVIDTENEFDLEMNIEQILKYLDQPLQSKPCFKRIPCFITQDDILKAATEFQKMILQHTKLVHYRAEEQYDKFPFWSTPSSELENWNQIKKHEFVPNGPGYGF